MEATSASRLLSPELQASLRSAGLTLQIAQENGTAEELGGTDVRMPSVNCLLPLPYQLDQSGHARLTEPRFSLAGDALFSCSYSFIYILVI